MGPSLSCKFLDDEIELRELLARETLLEDGSEFAVFFRKKSKVAFRAADVARKNHSNLSQEWRLDELKHVSRREWTEQTCTTARVKARCIPDDRSGGRSSHVLKK
jgi:hypothetical protein